MKCTFIRQPHQPLKSVSKMAFLYRFHCISMCSKSPYQCIRLRCLIWIFVGRICRLDTFPLTECEDLFGASGVYIWSSLWYLVQYFLHVPAYFICVMRKWSSGHMQKAKNQHTVWSVYLLHDGNFSSVQWFCKRPVKSLIRL